MSSRSDAGALLGLAVNGLASLSAPDCQYTLGAPSAPSSQRGFEEKPVRWLTVLQLEEMGLQESNPSDLVRETAAEEVKAEGGPGRRTPSV